MDDGHISTMTPEAVPTATANETATPTQGPNQVHFADTAATDQANTIVETGLNRSGSSIKGQRQRPERKYNGGGPATAKELELIIAASNGDVDSIKALLADGVRADIPSESRDTAVHEAARKGHVEALDVLLEHSSGSGVDALDLRGGRGFTPLHAAIFARLDKGNEIVNLLLARSTKEVVIPDYEGKTPLHMSCEAKNIDIANAILNVPEAKQTVNLKTDFGDTALIIASGEGLAEIVGRLLKDFDADASILTNEEKASALHWAAFGGHDNVVKVLLAHGTPDPALQDNDGLTALHLAIRRKHASVVDSILSGAPGKIAVMMKALDRSDRPAWSYMIEDELFERSVRRLSSDIVDLSFRGPDGYETALFRATTRGNEKIVRALLAAPFTDPNITSCGGLTPLLEASYLGHEMIVDALLNHTPKPNIEYHTRDGSTALKNALAQGHRGVVARLLQFGADWETVATTWGWVDFQKLLDGGDWASDEKDRKEQLKLICLASDRDPKARLKLREQLQEMGNDQGRHTPKMERSSWTELQWAVWLGKIDIVWRLLSYLPLDDADKMIEGAFEVLSLVEKENQSPASTKDQSSMSEEQVYATIRNLLKDPPQLKRAWAELEKGYRKQSLPENKQECCKQFEATITNFYAQNNSSAHFLRRTRSVWDVIYKENVHDKATANARPDLPRRASISSNIPENDDLSRKYGEGFDNSSEHSADTEKIEEQGGPKSIMGAAEKQMKAVSDMEYTSKNFRFQWIHLPATNMEWMRDLSMRVYQEHERNEDEWKRFNRFTEDTWVEETMMKPGKSLTNPWCGMDIKGPEASNGFALYMPYLNYGTYKTDFVPQSRLEKRHETLVAAYGETNSEGNQEEGLSIKNKTLLHGSLTLDEFGYRSLRDTEHRDMDQVVTRYIARHPPASGIKKKELPILRVSNLWLWVLGKNVIITGVTDSVDEEQDPAVKDIFDRLRQVNSRERYHVPSTIDEMILHITGSCVRQIVRPAFQCSTGLLSARQIFAYTLDDMLSEEARLSKDFHNKLRRKVQGYHRRTSEDRDSEKPTSSKDDYRSISNALELFNEAKDIADELNILSAILEQQHDIGDALGGKFLAKLQRHNKGDRPQMFRGKLWLGEISNVNGMISTFRSETTHVREAIERLLDLEQNEASISQAQETIKQGRTLTIFTIVTLIFLPSSFLTSLLAVNITAFPHSGDELAWGPRSAFSLIFGLTAAVCLLTFASVWKYDWILRQQDSSRLWFRKLLSSKEIADEEAERKFETDSAWKKVLSRTGTSGSVGKFSIREGATGEGKGFVLNGSTGNRPLGSFEGKSNRPRPRMNFSRGERMKGQDEENRIDGIVR